MGNGDKKPEATRRRPMVVSKGWVQGIALVMVLGFTVMGILAYHTLSLIHISEPTRLGMISYAVFCLKKKK